MGRRKSSYLRTINRALAGTLLFVGGLASDARAEIPAPCLPNWVDGEAVPQAALLAGIGEAVGATAFSHRAFVSPAELRAEDPRLLAEMLVSRLTSHCEATRPPLGRAEEIRADLMMVVPASALPFIATHGFANQHLTQSSGGLLQTTRRLQKEEMMIGMQLPYSGKTRDLLPKYAFLNIHRDDVGKTGVPEMYGEVSVVFKPDVRKRMTWTHTDSLVVDFTNPPEEFPPRTAAAPFDTGRPLKCIGYCEAQIWGPLEARDVAHLMVPKGTPLSRELRALGVPVYEYDRTPSRDASREAMAKAAGTGQSVMFRVGERLWKGGKPDPVKETPADVPKVVRNIVEDRALAAAPAESLKKELSALQPAAADPRTLENYSRRARIFAELAQRGPAAGGEEFLIPYLKDADPLVRSEALIGLGDLPAKRRKEFVRSALRDPDRNVIFRAIAMAADFPKDAPLAAEVEGAIGRLQEFDRVNARERWNRYRQPTYCAPPG